MNNQTPFFIFDVESVGLHGEAFAVAGGVYIDGVAQSEFAFHCKPSKASGAKDDFIWITDNVKIPESSIECRNPMFVLDKFWREYETAKLAYDNIIICGECIWPVEARFMINAIDRNIADRKWKGPYPFHEIASFMLCCGFDPMKKFPRHENELPEHNPLCDARLSARIVKLCVDDLNS